MSDDLVTSPRRQPRETLGVRVQRNSAILTAAVTLGVALASALAAKVESCTAQAQSTATQSRQVEADVELDAAYKAIADKVDAQAAAIEALTKTATEQGDRFELLEAVVKAGLANTPAGKKFQPGESAAPDVELKDVTEPLPASPAAAAAIRRAP